MRFATAIPRRSLLFVCFFAGLLCGVPAAAAPARVANAEFEFGLDGWQVRPEGNRVRAVRGSECRSGDCLAFDLVGDDVARIEQSIGTLEPGSRYRMAATFGPRPANGRG